MPQKFYSYSERLNKASRRRGYLSTEGTITNSEQRDSIIRGDNIGFSDRPIISTLSGKNIDNLFDILKESPEYVGVVRALIHDVMAEGWDFYGSQSAKNQAVKFEKKSKYFWKQANALWDFFNYGDAMILKLSVTDNDIDNFIESSAHNFGITKKYGFDVVKSYLRKQLERGDMPNRVKDLQVLDSRTMYPILSDTGEVSGWQQKVPGKEVVNFKKSDIVHLTVDNVGGRFFGFTPAHTLLKDILTLALAKDYATKVYENDAVPAAMFNFPEVNPDDLRQVEFLQSQLEEIRKKRSKLSTILSTGKIEYTQLKTLGQEMEFRELITHLTLLILFAWGMPAHRLPLLLQRTVNYPKESNDGYFKSIHFYHKILETHWNDQLWSDFKVEMMFNRAYRIDEMREATIAGIVADRGLASIGEIREKWLRLPKEIPDDLLGPKKQTAYNFFDEDRDDRLVAGDDSDLMLTDPSSSESRDNKVR